VSPLCLRYTIDNSDEIKFKPLKMTSHTFEIEIKSLLGSKENSERLVANLLDKKPNSKIVNQSKQLNHYFEGGDVKILYENFLPNVSEVKKENFERVVFNSEKQSIRTRETDKEVILVIKASIGSHSSANGVERIEFELPVNMSLDELDKLVLSAGFIYQAKWSRERKEYDTSDMRVCIDKNAGYGYVAEFEKVISDESLAKTTGDEIRSFMKELDIEELAQDRLERMFDYYNKNWRDYYGTDKTFNIE